MSHFKNREGKNHNNKDVNISKSYAKRVLKNLPLFAIITILSRGLML